MKTLFFSMIVTAALCVTSPVLQAAENPTKANSGALDAKDRKFVTEAAQGGMQEVAVGKLATEKGTTPEVKKIGEMLVKDHSTANAELKKLATAKGVELPAELDREHSAVHHKLASQEGEKFDKEFVAAMDKDHKEDIAKFQAASKDLTDPELRAFAAKQLPVLEKHEQHVQMLEGKK
jgi:putative membrane protein